MSESAKREREGPPDTNIIFASSEHDIGWE